MLTDGFSIPSFAKINWFLRVFGRRDDGYHEICTALQTISLCDTLTFRHLDRLALVCDDPALDCGEDNLIIRAAKLLRARFGIDDGAEIQLEKRIPYPGGLGGGSSNAAMALAGLSTLWEIEPTGDELLELASNLGSDVPFFLYGGTALGTNRGEKIRPLSDAASRTMLLAVPDARIHTPDAYEMLQKRGLTKDIPDFILNVCRELASKLDSGLPDTTNDFESAVFEMAPAVKEVSDQLRSQGATVVGLSGSGAGLFAVFENDALREKAADALRREPSVRVFEVETVSRADYLEALGPVGEALGRVLD